MESSPLNGVNRVGEQRRVKLGGILPVKTEGTGGVTEQVQGSSAEVEIAFLSGETTGGDLDPRELGESEG